MKNLFTLKFITSLLLVLMLAIPTQALAAKGGGKPIKEEPPTNPEPTEQIVYTALGDSIATGDNAYGNDIPYVERYRAELEKNYIVDFQNLALSGLDSTEMLAQLTEEAVIARIQSSDLITISIGGNNIMHCRGFNFSSIDTACSQAGVEQFSNDWPEILAKVKEYSPNAVIYVNTVYNPYKGSDSNFAVADVYIKQINSIIVNSLAETSVIDVYAAFYGKEGRNWKVCNYTYFCNFVRDPHPNDAGQRKIAELHPIPTFTKEEQLTQ